MADEKTTLLIDVQVSASEALKRQEELKVSLQQQREDLKKLEVEQGKTSQAYIAQEATVKNLNNQLAANGRVLTQMAGTTTTVAGAYQQLTQRTYEATQRANDIGAAYGKNSAQFKKAAEEANGLKQQMKDISAASGNYQLEVGNYMGKFGGMIQSVQNFTTANGGLAGSFKAGGQAVAGFGKQLLALLANPIVAIIAAIAGAVMLMVNAMKSNGAATEKFNQILAPLKGLLASITAVLGQLVSIILDGVLAFGNLANAVMSLIPGLDKVAEKNREAIRLEREKQKLIREGIVDKAADAKEELRISELKKKIMQADKYSAEERLAFAREVDKAEKALALDDANRANNNLKNFLNNMKLQGKAQKDYTVDELKQLTDLQAAKYAEQQKYFDNTRRTASREATLSKELASEQQAINEKSAAEREKIRAEQEAKDKAYAEQRAKNVEAEIKAQDEAYKKMIESRDAALKAVNDLQFAITEEPEVDTGSAIQYQKDLEDAKQAIRESSDLAYLDYEQALLDKEYQMAIANAEKVGADTTAIEAAYAQTKKQLNQAEISAKMDMASNFAGNISEIFGKNTKIGKMAASAQIAIDTAKGAMAAYTSTASIPVVGPALGIVAAGAVIAKGARSIKDVWAVKSGLKGDSGGGGASVPTGAISGGVPASVTGGLVARQSGQTQQQATTQAMDAAMKANPQQPVLVTNDLTTALNQQVQLKSDNSL